MDDDLRAYLLDGGSVTARAGGEFGDDNLSLAPLWNWSLSQRWAWDELQRRLRVCLDQGRPPTGILASWAATVATGQMKPPRHKGHDDRDWRVLAVVTALVRGGGYSERVAVHMVATEIDKSPETVYSILRKIRAGPMARVRKTRQTFT